MRRVEAAFSQQPVADYFPVIAQQHLFNSTVEASEAKKRTFIVPCKKKKTTMIYIPWLLSVYVLSLVHTRLKKASFV